MQNYDFKVPSKYKNIFSNFKKIYFRNTVLMNKGIPSKYRNIFTKYKNIYSKYTSIPSTYKSLLEVPKSKFSNCKTAIFERRFSHWYCLNCLGSTRVKFNIGVVLEQDFVVRSCTGVVLCSTE